MKLHKILLVFLVFGLLSACKTNPFTGKRDLALIPNSQLFPMAFQQYDEVLKESKVIRGTKEANMVNSVGDKIAEAARLYLKAEGVENYLKDYKWEYHLIQSDQVNAWCMPGGKIAVYTGILPITQTEAGLAAVMGHEVSHALLNHGQRRMSQDQLTQLASIAGSAAFENPKNAQLFDQAFGLGTQLGVALPYSRKFEKQADDLGVKLMAIAGYDPEAAVRLWERMSQAGGKQPIEFLSTHPSNQSRINNISKQVDDAKTLARKFGVTQFQQ
ncbi:MAG TPA: M48 family metallopeptidase [Flavobacteriaceae bacterium]|nr:M48 family metallopeptidase [Flavobacteriaceae bacterium]